MSNSAYAESSFYPGATPAAEAVPFRYLEDSDVKVWLQEPATARQLLTKDTDYTLTGVGMSGTGSLQLTGSYADDVTVLIRRDTGMVQPEVFPPHEPLSSASIERGLDRLSMQMQERRADISDISQRALMVPEWETVSTLPPLAERMNKVLGFDANGNPQTAILTITTLSGVNFAVATIILLAAIASPTDGQVAFVGTFPRMGMFTFSSANLSTRVSGDPGQGVYVAPAAAATGASGAWVRNEALAGYLKAEWFGLDPALSDCSTVMANIRIYMNSRRRVSSGTNDSNSRVFSSKVYVGAGDFTIKTPEAWHDGDLLSGLSITPTFEGMGQGVTTFLYKPTTAGHMIKNSRSIGLRISKMTFVGYEADDATGASNWLYSQRGPSYAVQDCVFEDVGFLGTWKYGVYLWGDNNNSEFVWRNCSWSGVDLLAWLKSNEPQTFEPTSDGSDQFLNYSFEGGKYWNCTGPLIEMASGGNIFIDDLDVSAWGNNPAGFGSPTYLIRLLYPLHNLGMGSCIIDGMRVEVHDPNALIMECEWPFGNVSFRDCDFSPLSWVNDARETSEYFLFNYGTAGAGPIITFDKCQLPGKARFSGTSVSGQLDHVARYTSCTFVNVVRFSDYFVFDWPTSPIAYKAGLPTVEIKGCRALDTQRGSLPNYKQITEGTINPRNMGNALTQRWTEFRVVEGNGPTQGYNGGSAVMFIVGTHLRNFHIKLASGVTVDASTPTFTLKNQAGTTLATAVASGPASGGFDVTVAMDHIVASGGDILRVETDFVTPLAGLRVEVEHVG